MSNHDELIGTVVRDAHNGFWIILSPTKFLPVDLDTHKWLTAHAPKANTACKACGEGMPSVV